MSIPKKILMVGTVDIMDVLSALTELDILIAANYEEAIEKIHESVKTMIRSITSSQMLWYHLKNQDLIYCI